MVDDNPTIEQKSHFSAKTKQGEDVDFNTTLKFYVDPSGDVQITVVGSQPIEESKNPQNKSPGLRPEEGFKPPSQDQDRESKFPKDRESRAKPPHSDRPCMSNFNPCQGITDGVKAMKKLYSTYLGSGSKKKSKDSENKEELSESENEVLKNEKKYDL